MRDTSEGNIKEMIDQMLFFRGTTEEKPLKMPHLRMRIKPLAVLSYALLRSL
jgi:hypothetical protein